VNIFIDFALRFCCYSLYGNIVGRRDRRADERRVERSGWGLVKLYRPGVYLYIYIYIAGLHRCCNGVTGSGDGGGGGYRRRLLFCAAPQLGERETERHRGGDRQAAVKDQCHLLFIV